MKEPSRKALNRLIDAQAHKIHALEAQIVSLNGILESGRCIEAKHVSRKIAGKINRENRGEIDEKSR